VIRALLALLLALAAASLAAQEPFDPFGLASIAERPGARIPLDLAFTDAAGRRTTLREVGGGKPILLAPVLHDCPNLCGVTLAGLARALAGQPRQPGADFAVAAFGIDPREDADAAARDLARLRAASGEKALAPVSALVGRERDIRAVTDALGFRYAWDERMGQYAHVAATAVLTADGRLSSWIYGLSPAPEEVARAIAAASAGRTGSWTDRLLLLCYHYDPATGRYTPAIETMLRIAAFLTLAGLALLLWRLRKQRA